MAMRDLFASAVVSALVAAGTTYALQRHLVFGDATEVPSVIGLPAQSARALIEGRGFMYVVGEEREDPDSPAGSIIAQKPLMGSRIEKGQRVEVVVAKVPAPVKLPGVAGLVLAEAKTRLEEAKLTVGKVTEVDSDKIKAGSVISQNPLEGAEVKVGSPVELVVSKGVGTVPVPSVVGRSFAHAKDELTKAGLTVGKIRADEDDDHMDGVVLRQTPAANEAAPKGSAVDLVINRT
jgi:beta-lactam-binding protein with PASTA domain